LFLVGDNVGPAGGREANLCRTGKGIRKKILDPDRVVTGSGFRVGRDYVDFWRQAVVVGIICGFGGNRRGAVQKPDQSDRDEEKKGCQPKDGLPFIEPRTRAAFWWLFAVALPIRCCEANHLVVRLAFIHHNFDGIMADRNMQLVRATVSSIMGREHFAQSADLHSWIAVGLDVKILGTPEPVNRNLIGFGRLPRVGNRLFHKIVQKLRHHRGAHEIRRLQKRTCFRAEQFGPPLVRDRRRHYSAPPFVGWIADCLAARTGKRITGMLPSRAG